MNYEKIIRDLDSLGVNMMDIAIQPIGGEELYHKFQHCSNCMNGYSVTKSFTMTAIGMLMDEGKLDVEGKALPFLTDGVADELDPHWQDVTIEQMILHKAGYDADWLDIDTQDVNSYGTKDYLSYVMKKPLPHTPGEFYKYNDHCYYLLSRIAAKAAGEEMTAYLQRKVIDDLNFHEIAWSRCPQGYAIGATGLYSRADDTARFAQIYLHGGEYQGKRYLSKAWVDRVIEREYEFHHIANGLYVKGGLYGQGIGFNIEKGFTVAWHSMSLVKPKISVSEYLSEL